MKKYKLFDLSHYVGLYSEGGYIEINPQYIEAIKPITISVVTGTEKSRRYERLPKVSPWWKFWDKEYELVEVYHKEMPTKRLHKAVEITMVSGDVFVVDREEE